MDANPLAAAIARNIDKQNAEARATREQAIRDFQVDPELERLIERREADPTIWRMVAPSTKAAIQSYMNRKRLNAESANEGNDAA